jgi:hypothetical protein
MGKKTVIGLVSIAIVVVSILLAQDGSRLFLDMAGGSGSYTYNVLFNSGLGLMIGAVGLGIFLGAIAGNQAKGREPAPADRVGMGALLSDWGVSISSVGAIILFISGIFLGGPWSPKLIQSAEANGFWLNLHFFGMITLLFGVLYLATRMLFAKSISPFGSMGELTNWGSDSNYLPSHKVAILTYLVAVLALIVKGGGLLGHTIGLPDGLAVSTGLFHGFAALVALILLAAAIALWIFEKLSAQEAVVSRPSQA